MDLIEEYNVKLADIYNQKIKVELEKIELPRVDKERVGSLGLKEVEKEVGGLATELKEKKRVLEEVRRERMRKEKELVDMEVEFEIKKGRIVEAYRKRLKKKLEDEKKRKKK